MGEVNEPQGSKYVVRIRLIYGPMHDQQFDSHLLPDELMFVDNRDNRIIVYDRHDELEYRYNMEESGLRTGKFGVWKRRTQKYPMTAVDEG